MACTVMDQKSAFEELVRKRHWRPESYVSLRLASTVPNEVLKHDEVQSMMCKLRCMPGCKVHNIALALLGASSCPTAVESY